MPEPHKSHEAEAREGKKGSHEAQHLLDDLSSMSEDQKDLLVQLLGVAIIKHLKNARVVN